MKTRFHPTRVRRFSAGAAGLVLAPLLTIPAIADFSGGDSLAAGSAQWAELFAGSDRNSLVFRNSRLEYKGSDEWAYLQWKPNKGSSHKDWFIQVYADNNGRNDSISLGVLDAGNRHKGYVISVDSSSEERLRGMRSYFIKGNKSQYSMGSAEAAVLRIHFDSKAETLTASWKSRGEWAYFEPVSVTPWGMDDSSRFTAVLIGGGRTSYDAVSTHLSSPASFGKSIPAYFSHFLCGPAKPLIDVEQPAFNDLTDGHSKRGFGSAAVGNKGAGRTFTIRNNGTSPLRNLGTRTDAADFHATQPSATILAPGESTTFRVTFKPRAAGTRTTELHITGSDAEKPSFDIQLTGLGVEQTAGKSEHR